MKKRISTTIKLYKKGKTVLDTTFLINARVIASAQRELWDNGYIKVRYGHGYYNQADFTTLDELKTLLSVFTEKVLIDYFDKKDKL